MRYYGFAGIDVLRGEGGGHLAGAGDGVAEDHLYFRTGAAAGVGLEAVAGGEDGVLAYEYA